MIGVKCEDIGFHKMWRDWVDKNFLIFRRTALRGDNKSLPNLFGFCKL